MCLKAPVGSSWMWLLLRSNFTVIYEQDQSTYCEAGQEAARVHTRVCEFADLVDSRRNLGQVLPDAGHTELDLVADALLRTFGWMCSRDAEEAQQQDPGGGWTELLLRWHHSSSLSMLRQIRL